MKKYLHLGLFFLFILLLIIPAVSVFAQALGGQPIVPCNGLDCDFNSFFEMLNRIYRFIVWDIASPLAIIMIVIGAIVMMGSGGNPSLFNKGKNIVSLALIGIALIWCSYLIINVILTIIGYKGNWSHL